MNIQFQFQVKSAEQMTVVLSKNYLKKKAVTSRRTPKAVFLGARRASCIQDGHVQFSLF